MDDFSTFIQAIGQHWVVLMSGIVSVGISIWQYIKHRQLHEKLFWWVGVLCLFFACFLAWRDEHRALADEQKKNSPVLVGTIDETEFMGNTNGSPPQLAAFIQFSIRNLGMPSIAEKFYLNLFVDGKKFFIPDRAVPPAIELVTLNPPYKLTFHQNDMIYEKTISPLPTGGMVRGWLYFDVTEAHLDRNALNDTNVLWVVAFRDVTGKEYFVTNYNHRIASGPGYFPGSEFPVSRQ
jgi:hypothetical protein